jgi:hypothetical protein
MGGSLARLVIAGITGVAMPTSGYGQIAKPGTIAERGNGTVGERQTGNETSIDTAPLKRIESRIANRVQNRLRNRIDRYYDPKANAASPFEVAGDQARTAGTSPR